MAALTLLPCAAPPTRPQGNTLNSGRKPPQGGIKLSSLRKLADTRSFDGRTTLVHYLVALLSQSAPEVGLA